MNSAHTLDIGTALMRGLDITLHEKPPVAVLVLKALK